MNSRDFLDVRAICENGSLRKAAEALGISQPTLSIRVAHLEDQLGMQLFDRRHGRTEPTDLALFIARRAAVIADEEGRLAAELQHIGSGRSGLVRIGLGPALARVLIGRIVVAVHGRSPKVHLDLVSAPAHQLAAALARRELDFVVSEPADAMPEGFTSETLYQSDMVAVARPDHPLCLKPPAAMPGLLKYPIAVTFLPVRWKTILRRDHGVDLENQTGRVLCSDFEMVVRIVQESSTLFTVGPRLSFGPEIASGRLAIIGTAVPLPHEICLHVSRDTYPIPAVKNARTAIQRLFQELRKAAP